MEKETVEKFLELLDTIVNFTDMTYAEKKALIREVAGEDDITNLEEFSAWFEPEDNADQSSD